MRIWWIAVLNGLLTFAVVTYFGMAGLYISVPVALATLLMCVAFCERSARQLKG